MPPLLRLAAALSAACSQASGARVFRGREGHRYPVPGNCSGACGPCVGKCYDDCVDFFAFNDSSKEQACKGCVAEDNGCMRKEAAACGRCVGRVCGGGGGGPDCPQQPPAFVSVSEAVARQRGRMSEHCVELRDEIQEWEREHFEAGGDPTVSLFQGEQQHGRQRLMHAILANMDIAVARSREDTSWSQYLQDKGARVTVEAASSAASDEAGAFLRFLVDNYDSQRNVSVFLHGHAPTDWHSPGDLLDMVSRIDPDKLLKLGGYASLNLGQYRDQGGAVGAQDALTQYRMDCLWKDRLWVKLMRKRWGIQDGDFSSWAGYCCAQFALHRDTVRSYPKEFYQSLLETLTEPHGWGHDSYKSLGRAMEYLWHVIFTGKPIRERHYAEADFTYDV